MSNHPNADWDGIMKAQAREPKPPRVTWINRDAEVAQLRARIAELEAALAPFAAIKTSGPGALGYACEEDIACARAVLGGGDGAV